MESIKRMLTLTKAIVRTIDLGTTFKSSKSASNKSGRGKAGIIIMIILILYFGIAVFSLSELFYSQLSPLGLASLIPGYATAVFAFLTFLMGIFYIMSVFYFTSDIEYLLSLPFKPWEIVGAKFLSVVLFEYFTTSLVLIPFVVYGVHSGQNVLYYLYSLIAFALLPVLPLALASIIIMPVMRFIKFARNKDAFKLVSGVLILFLALGGNIFLQSSVSSNTDNLGSAINAGADKISGVASTLFPSTFFAAKALTSSATLDGFMSILIYITIVAVAFLLVLLLANALYIKAATAVSSAASSRKKLNSKQISAASKNSSPIITYMKKDIFILLRTPIYFMNNVIMNFLWPILIVLILTVKSNDEQSIAIAGLLKSIDFSNMHLLGSSLFFIFGVAILISGMNGIAASALSREGSSFNVMKFIPMPYFQQIVAKVGVGALFGFAGVLFGIVVFGILLSMPLWFALLAVLVAAVASAIPHVIGIFFELAWPKLHWDNEQKAVKQNLNVIFDMLISMAAASLFIGAGIFNAFDVWLSLVVVLLLGVTINVVSLILLKGSVEKMMNNIVY